MRHFQFCSWMMENGSVETPQGVDERTNMLGIIEQGGEEKTWDKIEQSKNC